MDTIDVGALTATGVLVLWATFWSFFLEYFPKVKNWFDALDVAGKKRTNFIGIFVVVAGAYLLSYFEVINAFPPDVNGLILAGTVLLGSLGIGQGVHAATKKS